MLYCVLNEYADRRGVAGVCADRWVRGLLKFKHFSPTSESVTLPLKPQIFLRERLQWINCRASALGGVDTKTLFTN